MIDLIPEDVSALTLILGQLYSYLSSSPTQWRPSNWNSRSTFVVHWRRALIFASDFEPFCSFYSMNRSPTEAPGLVFAFLLQRANQECVSPALQKRLEEVYDSHSRLMIAHQKALEEEYYQQLLESCEAGPSLSAEMDTTEVNVQIQPDKTLEDLETASNIVSIETKSTNDPEISPVLAITTTKLQPSFGSVLHGFFCWTRNKSVKKVKKEYFRTQHIRAMKKSIRQIASKKEPSASIHRLKGNNEGQKEAWAKLKHFFQVHSSYLSATSQVCTEPTRRSRPHFAPFKSFNNTYCKSFFTSPPVQQYTLLFCDLVYDHQSSEELCTKMRFLCCLKDTHSAECCEKWKELKQYARGEMLEELGLRVEHTCEEPEFYLAEPK